MKIYTSKFKKESNTNLLNQSGEKEYDGVNKMIALDGTIIIPELCDHSSSLESLMYRFEWNGNCYYYDIHHTIYDENMKFVGVFAERGDKNFKMFLCDLGKDMRTCEEVVSHIENMIDQKDEKTKAFILKAQQKHGYKYDYSTTVYTHYREKLTIICEQHGSFRQRPDIHFRSGCKLCGFISTHSKNRKSHDIFVNEATKIYGNKYDYNDVQYVSGRKHIKITCLLHKIHFNQIPDNHLQGKEGCNKCATIANNNIKKTWTLEQFIERANKKYRHRKYSYEKTTYVNSKTKIIVCCLLHGDFSCAPAEFLRDRECTTCAIESRNMGYVTNFIKIANIIHKFEYDYTEMHYVNANTKIKIKCRKGHAFMQRPSSHLNQVYPCVLCYGWGKNIDTNIFVYRAALVHNGLYDYSRTVYTNADSHIEIICKEHGIFSQLASTHLAGSGCNNCRYKYSKVQMEWLNLLENALSIKINHAKNVGEHLIKKSRYYADGYYEEKNTILEFHGCFFHGCTKCFKNRDDTNKVTGKTFDSLYKKTKIKEQHCKDHGYNYISIWECDWNKIKKTDDLKTKYLDTIRVKLDIDDDVNYGDGIYCENIEDIDEIENENVDIVDNKSNKKI